MSQTYVKINQNQEDKGNRNMFLLAKSQRFQRGTCKYRKKKSDQRVLGLEFSIVSASDIN